MNEKIKENYQKDPVKKDHEEITSKDESNTKESNQTVNAKNSAILVDRQTHENVSSHVSTCREVIARNVDGGHDKTIKLTTEIKNDNNEKIPSAEFKVSTPVQTHSEKSPASDRNGNQKVDRWEKRLEEYKRFIKIHGHCNVPSKSKDKELWSLGGWVKKQRKEYNAKMKGRPSPMNPERQRKLDEIGFRWSAQEGKWNDNFKKLLKFKEKFGHVNVSSKWKEDRQLGNWVDTQRSHLKHFKEGKKTILSPEKIKRLNDVGFQWVRQDFQETWENRYAELVSYKNLYGDCDVPTQWKQNLGLGQWVKNQKKQARSYLAGEKSSITAERWKKFQEIGLECEPEKSNGHNSEGLSARRRRNRNMAIIQLKAARQELMELNKKIFETHEQMGHIIRKMETWEECLFCHEQKKVVVMLPCRHVSFCDKPDCVNKAGGVCPICGERAEIYRQYLEPYTAIMEGVSGF
mmetsp:Transcript_7136/g.10227  ORF Transcript_7136/g.10227 Transcript_7136/m.10227 type:complete len:462 (-) Transcript_7136:54-1439(-)